MSIEILIQDADIIVFKATTDIGTHTYKYSPKKGKYYAMYKKHWVEVAVEEAGIIEYHLYRAMITGC